MEQMEGVLQKHIKPWPWRHKPCWVTSNHLFAAMETEASHWFILSITNLQCVEQHLEWWFPPLVPTDQLLLFVFHLGIFVCIRCQYHQNSSSGSGTSLALWHCQASELCSSIAHNSGKHMYTYQFHCSSMIYYNTLMMSVLCLASDGWRTAPVTWTLPTTVSASSAMSVFTPIFPWVRRTLQLDHSELASL